MSDSLVIERVAGPVTVMMRTFGSPVVSVSGQAISGRRGFYDLPATNGETVEARIRPKLMDPYPQLEVSGTTYRTGPDTPLALRLAAILPIALIAVGGLVGGLIGVLGVLADWAILRSGLPLLGKVAAIGAVIVATLVIALAVATAVNAALG